MILINTYVADAHLDIQILRNYSVSDLARLKLPMKSHQTVIQLKRAINMYTFEHLYNHKLNRDQLIIHTEATEAPVLSYSDTSVETRLTNNNDANSIVSSKKNKNLQVSEKKISLNQTFNIKTCYQRITTQSLSKDVSILKK